MKNMQEANIMNNKALVCFTVKTEIVGLMKCIKTYQIPRPINQVTCTHLGYQDVYLFQICVAIAFQMEVVVIRTPSFIPYLNLWSGQKQALQTVCFIV